MSIYLNGELIEPTIFSDGTSQVWKLKQDYKKCKKFTIDFNFENEAEVFQLVQLVTLIKHGRVPCPLTLHIPFLPYGRQDKKVSNETTFALKSFSDIINSLGFDRVSTLDAHSKVGYELIDNFQNIYPEDQINHAVESLLQDKQSVKKAYPDKGACERYWKKGDCIIGHKIRDQLTGYIKEYNIEGSCRDEDVLIIDDLCDGGMTFKLMSDELYKQGASSVHLYVTHGIFSKGLETLRENGIQRIFTKNGEIFNG